jgi:phosphate transport system permease protein
LIALRYGDASAFRLSALMAAGLALFLVTMAVNFLLSSSVRGAKRVSGAAVSDVVDRLCIEACEMS